MMETHPGQREHTGSTLTGQMRLGSLVELLGALGDSMRTIFTMAIDPDASPAVQAVPEREESGRSKKAIDEIAQPGREVMLMKELRIRDLLVLPGEQVIKLPASAKATSLPSSPETTPPGRMSFKPAIRFPFYGHLPRCSTTTAWRFIHAVNSLSASPSRGPEPPERSLDPDVRTDSIIDSLQRNARRRGATASTS